MFNFNQIYTWAAVVLILAACGSGNKPTAQTGTDPSPVANLLKENNLQGQVVLIEFGLIGNAEMLFRVLLFCGLSRLRINKPLTTITPRRLYHFQSCVILI
jgi:hypothetical protein